MNPVRSREGSQRASASYGMNFIMSLKPSLLWKELLMFGAAQFLGIWSAFKLLPLVKELGGVRLEFSLTDVIFLVIFGALFFFLLTRTRKGGGFFIRAFLVLVVFSGSQIIFVSFFNENIATFLALFTAALFYFARFVMVQNIAMILAIAGIGSIFGLSVTPFVAVIILLALSFYDIAAVYWTKHMVKMAEGMIRTRNIFGIIIPETISGLGASMKSAQPGKGFMILGSGDIVMPIILAASVVSYSLLAALVIGIFSLVGLVITHILFVSQKIRRPMAALPPIAVMSIIGYLVSVLIF